MRLRIAAALVIALPLAVSTTAVQGEALKIASRMEIVEYKEETSAAPSPFAAMAPMMKSMMLPDGPLEQVMYVRGDAVRTEMNAGLAIFPKGTVLLKEAGKTEMLALNPEKKTYSKLPTDAGPLGALQGMKPDVTLTPTGQTETIVGANAEKHTVVMKFPLPNSGQAAPGMPTEMRMDGEVWIATGVFKPEESAVFERMQKAIPAMGAMGLDKLNKPGSYPIRSRMRISMMPGFEMRSEVTSISRVPMPDDQFKLPEGFKEVPLAMPGVPR
jgi:hypothetical protein